MGDRSPTVRNLAWGASCGVLASGILSLLVVFQALAQGSWYFEDQQVWAGTLVWLYLTAGVLGGSLVGLLRPFAASRVGAFLIGALSGSLFWLVIGSWRSGWSWSVLAAASVLGLVSGGGLGLVFWSEANKGK